jgi:CrcB protein
MGVGKIRPGSHPLMESPLFLPVWIALGAIPGALSRYYLTRVCTHYLGENFPTGTFLINVSGTFLMGFGATALQAINAHPSLNGFVTIGFLGSYTTFSTYALDATNLLRRGNTKRALLYGLGSPLLGFLSVEVGIALAQQL